MTELIFIDGRWSIIFSLLVKHPVYKCIFYVNIHLFTCKFASSSRRRTCCVLIQ